jgi:hypothetical protein
VVDSYGKSIPASTSCNFQAASARSPASLAFGREGIRITAPDEERVHRLRIRGQAYNHDVDGLHRSETELDGVVADKTIQNDGAIDALRSKINSIV